MGAITVKIMDGKYENPDAIENVINYVMRLDNMGLTGGYGVTLTCAADIINQFHIVKKVYGITGGKQVMHIIFSVDKTTYLKENHLVKLGYLLGKYFGRERQVLFNVHNDKVHLHIHMVVNTIAYTNGAYCGYVNIEQLRNYAQKCVNSIMSEVWMRKNVDFVALNEILYTTSNKSDRA